MEVDGLQVDCQFRLNWKFKRPGGFQFQRLGLCRRCGRPGPLDRMNVTHQAGRRQSGRRFLCIARLPGADNK